MRPKAIILGLDGATWDLMTPWIEAGELPHIAHLVETGASGELESTLEPITPCAWASMVTGKNPGKTGVFDFSQVVRGTYDVRFPNRTHVAGPSLWRQAETHGLRCGVVNIPMGYPADHLEHGVYIAGMGAPSTEDEGVFWPRELRQEVEDALGGPYQMMEFAPGRRAKEGYALLRKSLLAYTDYQRRLSLHLLSTRETDFFFIVFPSTDQVGHWFWKFHDPKHPAHDPAEALEFGKVMLEVYQEVDKAVGEILAAHAGPETFVWLLSDHGMGPYHLVPDLLGFLADEGYLRLKMEVAKVQSLLCRFPILARLPEFKFRAFTGLKRLAPRWLRGLFNKAFGKQKQAFLENMSVLSNYDWENTKVYVTDSGVAGLPKNMGELHINLKGREPRGIVEPADYEALRDEVIALFEGVHLEDGTRAVLRVHRREDIYSGPFLAEAPDLVVEWNLGELGCIDPGEDEIPPRYRPLFRPLALPPGMEAEGLPFNGFHRMEGVWVAQGPGIRAGAKGINAKIWDPYLEILSAMGVPVPDDIDSAPMGIWEAGREPVVKREDTGAAGSATDYTPEEEAALKARLKEMGYLS